MIRLSVHIEGLAKVRIERLMYDLYAYKTQKNVFVVD